MEMERFLKNHADTLTIIGVNIGIGAILISMWLSHASRMDAVNARMDTTHALIRQESLEFRQKWDSMHGLIYQEIKDFHGRMCVIEERNKGKG